MYKPTDIVAVYGEVRSGGNLVNKEHQIWDITSPKHSEPAICEVVNISGNNIEVKNSNGSTSIVAKGQCRLVKRDGSIVSSKKAKFSVKIYNREYGTYHTHQDDTFDNLEEAKSFIRESKSSMESDQEDYNEEETEVEIRKFIDISDEV